jgi:hypothetical protein
MTISDATQGALLTTGINTQVSGGGVTASDPYTLDPDPWTRPTRATVGHTVSGSVVADLSVRFHRELGTRTCYLVVATTAPLTGSYVVEVDGVVSTYAAAAEPDLASLLAEWAAQIVTDLAAITAAVVVPYGDGQAIRISGDATTAGYTTYALGASTSAPAAAAMRVVREVDSASLTIRTRTAATATSTYVSAPGPEDCRTAWGVLAVIGILTSEGYDERARTAGRSAYHLHLTAPVLTDEAIPVVTSGDGVYGVHDTVSATVAVGTAS